MSAETNEWISVNDKLPDVNIVDVVINDENGAYRGTDVAYNLDIWAKEKTFRQYQHTDNGMSWVDISQFVTHWKYLPIIPKTK